MSERVRGRPAEGLDFAHPQWEDGTPILLGQEVDHVEHGWAGFVCGIPNSDEVDLTWYGEHDVADSWECAPDELWRHDEGEGGDADV